MGDLSAIVYVSTATRLFGPAELEDLLRRSRARNIREGLTGLLLFADGSFMQHIEGPRDRLQSVWSSIRMDPMHHGIIELVNEPVEEREFANWAMAFSPATTQDLTELSGAAWTPPADTLSPPRPSGRELLQRFWMRQERSRGRP